MSTDGGAGCALHPSLRAKVNRRGGTDARQDLCLRFRGGAGDDEDGRGAADEAPALALAAMGDAAPGVAQCDVADLISGRDAAGTPSPWRAAARSGLHSAARRDGREKRRPPQQRSPRHHSPPPLPAAAAPPPALW
eukprot:gene37452-52584_t